MPVIRATATILALLAAAPALAGSPFEGRWEGPWTSRVRNLQGTFAFTVDAKGAFTGTTVYRDNHGTISGRIDDAGDLTATYKYGVIPYHAKAHLTRDGDHLRGAAEYSLPVGPPFDYGPVHLTRR